MLLYIYLSFHATENTFSCTYSTITKIYVSTYVNKSKEAYHIFDFQILCKSSFFVYYMQRHYPTIFPGFKVIHNGSFMSVMLISARQIKYFAGPLKDIWCALKRLACNVIILFTFFWILKSLPLYKKKKRVSTFLMWL